MRHNIHISNQKNKIEIAKIASPTESTTFVLSVLTSNSIVFSCYFGFVSGIYFGIIATYIETAPLSSIDIALILLKFASLVTIITFCLSVTFTWLFKIQRQQP